MMPPLSRRCSGDDDTTLRTTLRPAKGPARPGILATVGAATAAAATADILDAQHRFAGSVGPSRDRLRLPCVAVDDLERCRQLPADTQCLVIGPHRPPGAFAAESSRACLLRVDRAGG